MGRAQKCRESGCLAADTAKSTGCLHSFQDDTESQNHLPGNRGSLWADIGAAWPQSWEFSGDDRFHVRGIPGNPVNGIKGQRPENRTRSAFLFFFCKKNYKTGWKFLVSSHSVPSLVAGRGSKVVRSHTYRSPDVHQRTRGQGARMDLTGQLIALKGVISCGPILMDDPKHHGPRRPAGHRQGFESCMKRSRGRGSRQSNSVWHQGPDFFVGVGSGLRLSHVRLSCG